MRPPELDMIRHEEATPAWGVAELREAATVTGGHPASAASTLDLPGTVWLCSHCLSAEPDAQPCGSCGAGGTKVFVPRWFAEEIDKVVKARVAASERAVWEHVRFHVTMPRCDAVRLESLVARLHAWEGR